MRYRWTSYHAVVSGGFHSDITNSPGIDQKHVYLLLFLLFSPLHLQYYNTTEQWTVAENTEEVFSGTRAIPRLMITSRKVE